MNSESMLMRMLVILGIVSPLFFAGCGGGMNQSLNNPPPPPNPIPTITSISPNTATTGSASFTLTVNGTNFVAAAVIRFGGTAATATFVNSTQLTAAIPAAAIASAGTPAVTVSNPGPGGGTSNAANFAITGTGGAIASCGTNPDTWSSVAVAPDVSGKFGKFVYVANSNSNNVSMFAINTETGALTFLGRIAAGTAPQSVAVHPSGKYVYVANDCSDNVSMYTISASGILEPLGSVYAGESPISVAVDLSGRFAYVVNEVSNDISMYTINTTTGILESLGPIAAGAVPTALALDPSTKFAYVANADPNFPLELNNHPGNISVYIVGAATGVLATAGTIPAGIYPRSVVVDPSGKFAYVANCGDFEKNQGDVQMYTITAGILTSIGTIGAGSCPLSVAVHPSGKFAYAVSTGSDGGPDIEGVSMYTINPTGALTSQGIVENTGYCPSSIAVDPQGKFAYVTNHCDNTISMYTIDLTTGSLTLLGTVGS